MGWSVAQKIIAAHLVDGAMSPGSEISIRIDQTLTQDSTGTMAYLQFEAIGLPRVRTKLSVAYVDHNTIQSGFENADDHKYLQSVASRFGVRYSRPGNGVCHQVHIERFGVPGQTLLGSDSHTPTCGGLGMLAIGAGGLDVAVAMGGGPYFITVPKIHRITLKGRLKPWVSAKDVILEVLRRLTVKGGVGRIVEYGGEGIASLTVPERATIANMGAELGATTSIFPSDAVTLAFLTAQDRAGDFVSLEADKDAVYDEETVIDLDALVPLTAKPHSPDNVAEVSSVGPIAIDQVCIGSCTNSSYLDMMKVASVLKGNTVHPDVSLVIAPGSRQVLSMLASNGALADMISAGARILESACGPCIGMGQSPRTGAISLRTFNRNFEGRSGTASAQVYLVSPETAAASALAGVLTDPRTLGAPPSVSLPPHFEVNDNLVLLPSKDAENVEIVRGPNIKPFPRNTPMAAALSGKALIRLGDNITTDHIMPSNAKLLPYRSNVPYLAGFCLTPCDPDFPQRARTNGGGFIVGGSNYGQGSSREHAALAPLELGIRVVLAVSFARIHMANLINSGILPLTFADVADYEKLEAMDELVVDEAPVQIREAVGGADVLVRNVTKGSLMRMRLPISTRQADILLAGGLLNFTRKEG
jgi:aconitate hydratase